MLFAGEEELGEVSEGAPEGAPVSGRGRPISLVVMVALVTAGIVAAVVYRTLEGRKTGIPGGILSQLKRREKIESLGQCKR